MINGGACISLLTKKERSSNLTPVLPLVPKPRFFHKNFFLIILSSSPNTDFSKKHGTQVPRARREQEGIFDGWGYMRGAYQMEWIGWSMVGLEWSGEGGDGELEMEMIFCFLFFFDRLGQEEGGGDMYVPLRLAIRKIG